MREGIQASPIPEEARGTVPHEAPSAGVRRLSPGLPRARLVPVSHQVGSFWHTAEVDYRYQFEIFYISSVLNPIMGLRFFSCEKKAGHALVTPLVLRVSMVGADRLPSGDLFARLSPIP